MADQPVINNDQDAQQIEYSWKGNRAVNVPIFFALAGFLIGVLILNGKGCNTTARYHDLCLENKRAIIDSIQHKRISLITGKLDSFNARRNRIKKSVIKKELKSSTSSKRSEKVDSFQLYTDSIILAQGYLDGLRSSLDSMHYLNADTSIAYFKQYFSIDRDSMAEILSDNDNRGLKVYSNGGIPVRIYQRFPLLDTGQPETMLLKLGWCGTKEGKTSLMAFFSKNAAFGFWFFLALAQIMMWFILIPVLTGIAKSTNKIVDVFPYNFKNGLLMALVPVLVISLFVFLVYLYIVDIYIVGDQYFLDGFTSRMTWYSVFGYGVATLCFSVYLFLANKLQLLNEFSGGIRLAEDNSLQEKYLALRKAFDFAFLVSAIILSVFVLWMGVMFNAMNDLEAFRFYRELSGKNFFDNNLVYLNGLLHSVLLLVFYLPVRLQFNQLRLTKEQKDMEQEGASGTKKIFKSFWEGVSSVLLTTSPLIATFLEKFISHLGE